MANKTETKQPDRAAVDSKPNGRESQPERRAAEDVAPSPSRKDWRYANLRGANLRGVNLSGVNFEFADMRACDMRGADCTGALFSYADMRGSRMQGAVFQNASLAGAQMQGVDAQQVDFTGADMRGCNLGGACLDGARMPQAEAPVPEPKQQKARPVPNSADRAQFQQKPSHTPKR
jgi:hypothetical protein